MYCIKIVTICSRRQKWQGTCGEPLFCLISTYAINRVSLFLSAPSFSLPVLSLWLWLEVLTVRLQVGVYVLCTCACKCVTSTLPGLLPKWYQSARRKSNSAELYCVSNIATHDCFVCQFKLPVSDIACKINTTLSFLTCFGWEEWRFWFWITPACLF